MSANERQAKYQPFPHSRRRKKGLFGLRAPEACRGLELGTPSDVSKIASLSCKRPQTAAQKPGLIFDQFFANPQPSWTWPMGREIQAQLARLTNQFIHQNQGILHQFGVIAEMAYDGSNVNLQFRTGARIDALPLFRPTAVARILASLFSHGSDGRESARC